MTAAPKRQRRQLLYQLQRAAALQARPSTSGMGCTVSAAVSAARQLRRAAAASPESGTPNTGHSSCPPAAPAGRFAPDGSAAAARGRSQPPGHFFGLSAPGPRRCGCKTAAPRCVAQTHGRTGRRCRFAAPAAASPRRAPGSPCRMCWALPAEQLPAAVGARAAAAAFSGRQSFCSSSRPGGHQREGARRASRLQEQLPAATGCRLFSEQRCQRGRTRHQTCGVCRRRSRQTATARAARPNHNRAQRRAERARRKKRGQIAPAAAQRPQPAAVGAGSRRQAGHSKNRQEHKCIFFDNILDVDASI